ncbi:MAG: hypothetical protein CO090_05330 [Acidobacteria bacterium CG_4_9_14_3_um_filter_49_7]|nr:MAG: hypothetical protein CO090_05330 [Acidobacteria bacterium CG_4_9_14_3_um_filter_49_7]
MEVSCPNCSKKYRVDESLIPEKGRKVKCRKCENVFVIQREKSVPPPETGFNLDLDFKMPPEAAGSGTVRISQEQIDASIRKGEEANQSEKKEEQKIELDLESKMPQQNFVQDEPTKDQDPNSIRYIVRVEGNEFTGLTLDELKKWISEDRLLEPDEVSREGSKVWVPAERVPELMKVFKMHVYEQRKHFDEEDNPYLRYKEREENQVSTAKKGGFFSNILSMFRKG